MMIQQNDEFYEESNYEQGRLTVLELIKELTKFSLDSFIYARLGEIVVLEDSEEHINGVKAGIISAWDCDARPFEITKVFEEKDKYENSYENDQPTIL